MDNQPTGTFTIDYIVGGGVESNIGVGELVQIDKIEFEDDRETFNTNQKEEYYNNLKTQYT